MFENTQPTPCHASEHGSPPIASQPINCGYCKLTNKLFIAVTVKKRRRKINETYIY
jgi:hypothetical protein